MYRKGGERMFGKGQQKIIMRTKSPPRTSNRELKQRRF